MFIRLFDLAYDTYEGLKERAPWCFDVVLAVASQICTGNGPPSSTFYKCLDEARGIARSAVWARGGEGSRREWRAAERGRAAFGRFGAHLAVSLLVQPSVRLCRSRVVEVVFVD